MADKSKRGSYFYLTEGVSKGPLGLHEMFQLVQMGELRGYDLVYSSNQAQWRFLMDVPEFHGAFSEKQLRRLYQKPWVCLRRRSPRKKDYQTIGPMSTREIRENLLSGQLRYTDYVWRPGFSQWRKIFQVHPLNPRALRLVRALSETAVPGETAVSELRDVVQLKPKPVPQFLADVSPEAEHPPVPSEKVGRDLEQNATDTKPSKSRAIKVIEPKPNRSKRKFWRLRRWPVVESVLLIGVIMGLVVVALSFRRSVEKLDPRAEKFQVSVPPPLPQTPEGTPSDPVPVKAPIAAASGPVPTPGPVKLDMNVTLTQSDRVRLMVSIPDRSDSPTYVQVIGTPGWVIGKPHFYFYRWLGHKKGGSYANQEIEVKLPQGRFMARLQSGESKVERYMTVGQLKGPGLDELNRTRKLYANVIWQERSTLLSEVLRLESAVGKLMNGRPLSTKGFSRVLKIKRSSGDRYVLFLLWYEMADIVRDGQKGVDDPLRKRVADLKQKLSRFTVWK